jgi:hypothetical protein
MPAGRSSPPSLVSEAAQAISRIAERIAVELALTRRFHPELKII